MLEHYTFVLRTDVVVVDTNPEFADMSNPRGEIYGDMILVEAFNAAGDTKFLTIGIEQNNGVVSTKAESLATALNRRMASGKHPIGFDKWQSGRAIYGSDAWTGYGEAEQLTFERDMED